MIPLLAILLILTCFCAAVSGVILVRMSKKKSPPKPAPINVEVDLSGIEARIVKKMSGLPDIITNSITGSANTHKGKLGELIGYMSMKAEYDRIVPLGTIVDFMGIKFPTETDEGYVHFIDIKTGKHARFTKDQKMLKKLLDKKNMSFRTIRVDDIETPS